MSGPSGSPGPDRPRSDRPAPSLAEDAARRTLRHFAGRDADGEGDGGTTDPVEVWGRRIGRALSVVLAVALVCWLVAQLGALR